MNRCPKNCSCERCQSSLPVIKAIDICHITPNTQTPAVSPSTYGNFFQTNFITLANNQAMPWNGMGETSGITLDPDTVTIRVSQGGAYYIDYHVNGNFSPFGTGNVTIITALFVNNAEVNPIQTRYGALNTEVDRYECVPITGGTIVFIPDNGTVQLRNIGPDFRTCDGGIVLAASINLIKVSSS